MKILQVNKLYHPWIGGIETAAKHFAEHYDRRDDLSVTNLVCSPHGKRQIDEIEGVTTYRAATWTIKFGMPLSLDFFLLFWKLSQSADLIVIHHPFPLAFVAFWLFARNKRLVIWYHSDIVRQRVTKLPFEPFLRYGLQRADKVIVSNHKTRDRSKVLARHRTKCAVVYFGVDRNRFQRTDQIEKKVKEIKAGRQLLILAVGRLVYYKGFKYLIEAMRQVPAHLLIVGSGKLELELKGQISALGLEEAVQLIPHVDDLLPYYHACDIFALPSCENSEVFGIVQIEAMACGKPVVNTDLPTGVPEVSVAGITGYTVPCKQSTQLAEALNTLIENPSLYRRFSENAVKRVQSSFTTETMFKAMDAALANTLADIRTESEGELEQQLAAARELSPLRM